MTAIASADRLLILGFPAGVIIAEKQRADDLSSAVTMALCGS